MGLRSKAGAEEAEQVSRVGLLGEGLFDAETLRRRGFSFALLGLRWIGAVKSVGMPGLLEGPYGRACRSIRVKQPAGAGSGASRKSWRWRFAVNGDCRGWIGWFWKTRPPVLR